jgi:transcriptional regulator with XRE-family HTH domain
MYYNAQQIGARVRLLRKQRGMSQNEFAEMIGISRIYVAKIECETGFT